MKRYLNDKERKINNLLLELAHCNYDHPVLHDACAQLGIDANDIKSLTPSSFESENTKKEVRELRYSHLEARRKAKLTLIADFIIETRNLSRPKTKPKSSSRPISPILPKNRVDYNKEMIKNQEAERKKKILEKSLAKARFKDSRYADILKTKAAKRDEKIRKIKEEKEKAELEHENSAIYIHTELPSRQSFSRSAPRSTFALFKREEENFDNLLVNIQKKFNKSNKKYKEQLLQRLSGVVNFSGINVSKTQERLKVKELEENILTLNKIQERTQRSRKNKLDFLNEEVKRLKKTLGKWEVTRNTDHPDALISSTDAKIELYRQKKKQSDTRKGLLIAEKYKIKKNDVDLSLKKNQILNQMRKYKILDNIYK